MMYGMMFSDHLAAPWDENCRKQSVEAIGLDRQHPSLVGRHADTISNDACLQNTLIRMWSVSTKNCVQKCKFPKSQKMKPQNHQSTMGSIQSYKFTVRHTQGTAPISTLESAAQRFSRECKVPHELHNRSGGPQCLQPGHGWNVEMWHSLAAHHANICKYMQIYRKRHDKLWLNQTRLTLYFQ